MCVSCKDPKPGTTRLAAPDQDDGTLVSLEYTGRGSGRIPFRTNLGNTYRVSATPAYRSIKVKTREVESLIMTGLFRVVDQVPQTPEEEAVEAELLGIPGMDSRHSLTVEKADDVEIAYADEEKPAQPQATEEPAQDSTNLEGIESMTKATPKKPSHHKPKAKR